MSAQGEIIVEPNPAPEGGTVTITFPGPGPWFVREAGSEDDWVEISGVDAESHTVTIDVPAAGGGVFTITDNKVPDATSVSIPVSGRRSL